MSTNGLDDDRQFVTGSLNSIHVEADSKQRVLQLAQVQEVLLHKHPSTLLQEFLKKVLEFHLDTSTSVKCWLATFIQKVAQLDAQFVNLSMMKDCVETLLYLHNDGTPKVMKSVISSVTVAFTRSMLIICKTPVSPQTQLDLSKLWSILNQLRRRICNPECLDNENDGVRTQALHFLEILIIASSAPPPTPVVVATRKGTKLTVKNDEGFDITAVPSNHPLLDIEKLKKEGEQYFALLMARASSLDIKFSNISVIQQCLFNIAKQRPAWWEKIIPLLCNATLPNTLTSSQQISLRFSLRAILLYLLKIPTAKLHRSIMSSALKKLDCKQDAIDAAVRYADRAIASVKNEEKEKRQDRSDKKRKQTFDGEAPPKKKQRAEQDISGGSIPHPSIVFDTIMGKYNAMDLANVVVDNYLAMPVPPRDSNHQLSFISFANILMNMTNELDKNDSLEIQSFISDPLPPKPVEAAARDPRLSDPRIAGKSAERVKGEDDDDDMAEPQIIIPARRQTEQEIEDKKVARQITNQTKDFKSKARALSKKDKEFLLDVGWERLLGSETDIVREGKQHIRICLLVRMACRKQENSEWYTQLADHIKSDVKNRFELMLQWLYQEYLNSYKDHQKKLKQNLLPESAQINLSRYENLFHLMLGYIHEELDANDLLFARYFMEVPRITEQGLDTVCKYIEDPNRVTLGLITMRDIILRREVSRDICMKKLFEYSVSENPQIRSPTIRVVTDQLFTVPIFSAAIQEFATSTLKKLLDAEYVKSLVSEPEKPDTEQATGDGDEEMKEQVEEKEEKEEKEQVVEKPAQLESVKKCCALFASLCSQKGELLETILSVYSSLSEYSDEQEPKKTLLEEIKSLIRVLGPNSPHVIQFLRSFPESLESLALQFVETLIGASQETNTMVPQILIDTIKSIFFTRPQRNARFILPILISLTKDEVKLAMEQILNLPDQLVKVAMHRLILTNYTGSRKEQMSPEELLVHLHKLDNTQDQQFLKKIALATTCCFGKVYREVYTKNSLAIVLQQLVELTPLPQLLMRTVIQTLTTCPDLIQFVSGILGRLAKKRIWENNSLWRGFIKCLYQIKDKGAINFVYDVLAQLPERPIREMLTDKENVLFKDSLRQYALNSQPKNTYEPLLKHLGLKVLSNGDITIMSKEEVQKVANEPVVEENEK